ncbi:MAG TPA: MauE/DoxX family redox-associated membrane protein [Candidatus Angelobacter sp.]|nr:MauE/DoxX family redox-associated membrane protein [Candidatus Angelobacter sp.]
MPSKVLPVVDRAIMPIRLLFGALFLYTSVWHAVHATKLLQSIKDYQIISGSLVPWIGLLFIAAEGAIAITLIFGYFIRQSAIAAAALLAVFTGAMVSAIARGLDIACGCGLGDTHVGWFDVVRDVFLIAVALLIAWRADKEIALSKETAEQLSSTAK